jgi:hypothetical protein
MANDPSGAPPKAATPNPTVNPQVVTAADVRTPPPAAAGDAGGDPRAAAQGKPTPGVSTDAPKPDAPMVPHADPAPGTVKADQPGKEVSGSAHQLDTITTMGWVDRVRENSDGSFSNVHEYGPIQVPNPMKARDQGQDVNAVNDPGDKSPEEIRAANPAGSPLNPQVTTAAPTSITGGPPTPGAPQPTGKAGDVQAPAPRADAKSVPAPPAK